MTVFAPTRRHGRASKLNRGRVTSVITMLVMAGLITVAVTKMNLNAASIALSHASLVWVGVALVSVAGAFLARSESWHACVRAALPHVPVRRSVVARSLLIGVAASTVAPARVGEGVRTWLLSKRSGGCCATILGTVIAQTVLNLVALALLAVVTLTLSGRHGFHSHTIAIAIAVPILLLLALFAAGQLLTRRWDGAPAPHGARLFRRAGCWFAHQIQGTNRGMALFARPRTALHAGGCQLGAWALQCLACFSVLMALGMGHQTSVATAAAILLAINLSAIVPVTPGNVGLFQAACIAVLAPLGISSGHALAYGLLLQGVEIAVAVGLGIPAVLREGISLRELGQAFARPTGQMALAAS